MLKQTHVLTRQSSQYAKPDETLLQHKEYEKIPLSPSRSEKQRDKQKIPIK